MVYADGHAMRLGDMRDAFNRATVTGESVLQMSPEARREWARSALSQLDDVDSSERGVGEKAIQRILQPLFALSGYRLRAEKEEREKYRFDLIGENLLDGGDRLLVEFKFTRDGDQRSMVPEQIRNYVA